MIIIVYHLYQSFSSDIFIDLFIFFFFFFCFSISLISFYLPLYTPILILFLLQCYLLAFIFVIFLKSPLPSLISLFIYSLYFHFLCIACNFLPTVRSFSFPLSFPLSNVSAYFSLFKLQLVSFRILLLYSTDLTFPFSQIFYSLFHLFALSPSLSLYIYIYIYILLFILLFFCYQSFSSTIFVFVFTPFSFLYPPLFHFLFLFPFLIFQI